MQLPGGFPDHAMPNAELIEIDIQTALASSPVLRELQLQEQVQVELCQHRLADPNWMP